jgi:3-oxoacyl-[acyl-carrier protein] reductase
MSDASHAPTGDLLQGKVALVTGSSRGIGASIAKRFAQEGAKVVVHGRDTAALAVVRREIERQGGQVMHATCDLTNFAAIEDVREQIEDDFGPVDILVANAGGNAVPPGPVEEISAENWRAVVDGNLTATFLTIKSFLPGMKARKCGNIVTISSAAGRRPHPNSPIPYAVAKAGIALLTQDIAAQAGPYSIRANCIAPETIMTERNARQIPAETQKTLVDEHPIKRLGIPEDVANAALYLASSQSSWITGLVLDVAGGAVML